MKGKLIHCKGHEPIFIQPTFKQPWADVWINWAVKPGRKRMRCGPTLVSLPSAKQDLDLTKQCWAEHPDLDYSEDLEREEIIVTVLEAGAEIHCDRSLEGTPQITTSKDYIDRAEAERMLRFYLEQEHKLSVVRFKWHRPKHSLVVMPM